MPIGDILEKSLRFPWKHRGLWFYGILLALFSGISSSSNSFDSKDTERLTERINFSEPVVVQIIAVLAILGVIIVILGVIISAWSLAAMVKGTIIAEKGKEPNRKEIGKTGKTTVWRLIVLNIFIPIGLVAALILFAVPLVILFAVLPQPAGAIIGVIVGVIFILSLVPAIFYLSVVWPVASRVLILENKRPLEALRGARILIKKRFWKTFLFGMVVGLISGLAGFLAMLPLLALVMGTVFFALSKMIAGAVILGIIGLIYLVAYVFFAGYVQAFNQVGWTLWWKALKDGKVTA